MLVQQSIVAESLPTLLALTDKVSTVFHRVERENLLAGEHKAALELTRVMKTRGVKMPLVTKTSLARDFDDDLRKRGRNCGFIMRSI